MKHREIETTGAISGDGKIHLYMDELREFCKGHPNSKIVAKFFIYDNSRSEALKGYYFNYIVPTCRRAFWDGGVRMTEKDTEKQLRECSPVMWEETVDLLGNYKQRLRHVSELSDAEFVEYIESVRQFAAEELSVYIEDPDTFRDKN